MTIDKFLECIKVTPENAEERIAQARMGSYGCYGGGIDYDCRPSGVTLNGMSENEIEYSWDEILEYAMYQQIRMW